MYRFYALRIFKIIFVDFPWLFFVKVISTKVLSQTIEVN